MSLPWKKSGRISRFMSEFQQSRKRGGSLFVETGFSHSLIDLFVKNCDRLKRSSSKRLKRQNQTAPNASSPVIHDVILEKPVTRKTVRSKIDKDNLFGGGLTAEKNRAKDKNGYVCVGGGDGALVLFAFQVFIVALLALSTKMKLTLGITLSTIALLLTELVAGRVLTRFKPCSTTGTEKVKRVVSVHDKNAIPCEEKIETFDDSKDETEHVAVTEEPSSEDLTIRDLLSKDEKKSKSKSSRLKSKIVKKLKSYKKMKKTNVIIEETLTEVSSLVSEDKSEINESVRDEERSNPPLTQSKGDNMNGIVLIVIVLTGLLSGKILAFGLTLSCLFLRLGAAKKFGFRI
ncbi:unnamed protein product [Microthlaspi erraticum]|uniref:Uncharacterized protein n=1 Tax=Microthlaspi erraticum TaxID=1685480 RepID=A0A6D2HNU3_9BRAS|nr:unnamed protein product [Microthlaspi erraticum]